MCDSFTVCDTFHYAFNIRHDTLNYPETNFLDDFSYDDTTPTLPPGIKAGFVIRLSI